MSSPSRPKLPSYRNPCIQKYINDPNLVVKYHIVRASNGDSEQEIILGRIKISKPDGGRDFLLRRFDTGAVYLNSMFSTVFCRASDSEYQAAMEWVKNTFDLTGNNGSRREPNIMRLSGIWVSPQTALDLAKEYSIGDVIKVLVEAHPNIHETFRTSRGNGDHRRFTGIICRPFIVPKAEGVGYEENLSVVRRRLFRCALSIYHILLRTRMVSVSAVVLILGIALRYNCAGKLGSYLRQTGLRRWLK